MADEAEDDIAPEEETEEVETEESETEESEEETEEEETEEDSFEKSGEDDAGAQSRSRRESRNARQARENRELREKLARAEGELNGFKNTKPSVDPSKARQEREEKLALMSPEERERFLDREKIHSLEQESLKTQLLVADAADKNTYDLMCTTDPVAAKHKKEVEELLISMRRNGSTAPRETLLNYVIGKHAREAAKRPGMKKKTQQEKDAAAARVSKSKASPTSARGDAGRSKGGDDVESLRQRILDREARGDVN